jgi:hypothetical protein
LEQDFALILLDGGGTNLSELVFQLCELVVVESLEWNEQTLLQSEDEIMTTVETLEIGARACRSLSVPGQLRCMFFLGCSPYNLVRTG